MPILKEVFFACLEEGLEAGNKWNDLIEMVRGTDRNNLEAWREVRGFILNTKPMPMIESRVRYELLGKKWKEMEQGKKRKRIASLIEKERNEELGIFREKKSQAKPVEYYYLLNDLCNDEILGKISEEDREVIAMAIWELGIKSDDDKIAKIKHFADLQIKKGFEKEINIKKL